MRRFLYKLKPDKHRKTSKFGTAISQSFSWAAIVSGVSFLTLNIASYAQDNTASHSDDFTKAFRKLKRNDSLQFDMTTAPPPPEPPAWLIPIAEIIGAIFKVLAPILYILFWLGVGALIMGILYLLITTIMAAQFSKDKTPKNDTSLPLYQPELARARILLDEIDALAAQGKYAEAVHTLLFRSIQDIDANRPNVIRRSLTSREIGELAILTPNARDVFSNIAFIVERSFFGGQEIGKADFDTARAAYTDLTRQDGQWAGKPQRELAA